MWAATELHPHSLLLFLHHLPWDCWEYHNVPNLLGLIHPEIALCSQVGPQISRCHFFPTQEWVLHTDCPIKDRWDWSRLPHLANCSQFQKLFFITLRKFETAVPGHQFQIASSHLFKCEQNFP